MISQVSVKARALGSRFDRQGRSTLGLALVVVAAGTLVVRLPVALHQLNLGAKVNSAYSSQGRTLAAADSLDIDNLFIDEALVSLPKNATFAVLLPTPKTQAELNIPSVTVGSLRAYLLYLLLPHPEVPPDQADYLLCYSCDRESVRGHVTWVWSEADGEGKAPGSGIARRGGHA